MTQRVTVGAGTFGISSSDYSSGGPILAGGTLPASNIVETNGGFVGFRYKDANKTIKYEWLIDLNSALPNNQEVNVYCIERDDEYLDMYYKNCRDRGDMDSTMCCENK